ncbi:MAG: type I-C CRISPR-associated protein Cas8c/Csd1 [Firmicutes bacterium]|nr:type I-C CRISPR-associated protein Cas8c/Csd1 [Bacillota bacterium]
MSWTNELYQIYENNCGRTDGEPMLPIAHSTANAQVEVTLDQSGSFVAASTVEKADTVTVIPVTEDSCSRGNGNFPHPLDDKLIYLAGDYSRYVGGKHGDNREYYEAYLKQLGEWCASAYCTDGVRAVHAYISKGCLISDLIRCGIVSVDETTGLLAEKIKLNGIAQQDLFVRFRIQYDDLLRESRTWADQKLQESFAAFNAGHAGTPQLCYATGKVLPCTYKHPSKIRNAGDKAKLISANDESGFTYRGRFCSKEQALSVSYDFSQKMHIALKWLVERQGVSIGDLTLLVWESALRPVPDIVWDPWDDMPEEETVPDTIPAYRDQLKKTLFGYRKDLPADSHTMILALDSATTGRLSMTLYSELATTDFLSNLEKWHSDTAWIRFDAKQRRSTIRSFSLRDIAECAFGTEQGDFIKCKPEVLKDTALRLIPCETERKPLPTDIVNALVRKASNPQAYSNAYNFRRVLETACGMLRKQILQRQEQNHQKGECNVALNETESDRSYLFGRLLAIADKAESDSYSEDDRNKRVTNAKRYWSSFAQRPYQTWAVIEDRLRPYLTKLNPGSRVYYEKLLNEVMDRFTYEGYTSGVALDPIYLLGYHCQMQSFYQTNKKNEEE